MKSHTIYIFGKKRMRRSLLGSGKYTFTITADQSSTITIGGGVKQGTIYSADFKKGENVSWSVARTGYVTQSGTQKNNR